MWARSSTLKVCPHWLTSCGEAVPPPQTISPVKYPSLWGTFLFSLPHVVRIYLISTETNELAVEFYIFSCNEWSFPLLRILPSIWSRRISDLDSSFRCALVHGILIYAIICSSWPAHDVEHYFFFMRICRILSSLLSWQAPGKVLN